MIRTGFLSIYLFLCWHISYAQLMAPDTLYCGDTLIASFDPLSGSPATDSLLVWMGNCQSTVTFDFITADVPDGADMFYVDLEGTLSPAGSMPYFGTHCNGDNYFTQPDRYPLPTALEPEHCLPGYFELYGQGLPYQDSIVRKVSRPQDFKLSGSPMESARLHLEIPTGIVAVLFVVKFNPQQSTVLKALWDCSPTCCVQALGNEVCSGESIQLDTDREAIAYQWTGPMGFSSGEKSPMISQVSAQHTGWYKVIATYPFGCIGVDSVYIEVRGEVVGVTVDTTWICPGAEATLTAYGADQYQWLSTEGLMGSQGNIATVAPEASTQYTVIGISNSGCQDTAIATVIPSGLQLDIAAQPPTCLGRSDGQIQVAVQGGEGPYFIRNTSGNWQPGTLLSSLSPGRYEIEVKDSKGCMQSGNAEVPAAAPIEMGIGTQPPSCAQACDGEVLILPLSGQAPFQYRIAGQLTDSLVTGLCAGAYELEMTDQRGCRSSSQAIIEETAPFSINLGDHIQTRKGASISLEVDSNQPLDSVRWSHHCEAHCEASLTFTPTQSQVIHVEAWTASGCYATDSIRITVVNPVSCEIGLAIPSAFTPNGDGYNDRFVLYSGRQTSDIQHIERLLIYNRWGNVVFERENVGPGDELGAWDGYAKGRPAAEGVYTWVATFVRNDGKSFQCGGSVTLLR